MLNGSCLGTIQSGRSDGVKARRKRCKMQERRVGGRLCHDAIARMARRLALQPPNINPPSPTHTPAFTNQISVHYCTEFRFEASSSASSFGNAVDLCQRGLSDALQLTTRTSLKSEYVVSSFLLSVKLSCWSISLFRALRHLVACEQSIKATSLQNQITPRHVRT